MAEEHVINGNKQGIRDTVLDEMLKIYDMRMTSDEFASVELLSVLAKYTGIISREISVYIARDGRIADVSIGDSSTVDMPHMRLVRNTDRLCGVRCIHTHPSGDGHLSQVDLGTLKSSMLDAMAALGVKDGKFTKLYAAFLGDKGDDGERLVKLTAAMDPLSLPNRALLDEIILADNRLRSHTVSSEKEHERCIVAGMDDDKSEYDSLDELAELAKTAGAVVVGKFTQRKRPIDNATFIGSGKAEELSRKASELSADLIIFDDELSAIQLRNLENITTTRVIDRTQLILDIFAMRANSKEGRLQVELAQQKYRLPRLLGQGTVLSRLGGGIGTRGPGEKKLEIDRRRIRRRIYELEQELKEVEKQRGMRRTKRESIPLVALVGYTNAGKSTLTNALSGATEYVCDQLFATLDTVVRKITLPHGTSILISDTVGFINKLPHELVEAFHSTLEEVKSADLILHVVDSSSSYAQSQIEVVEDVLTSLECTDIPQVLVLNKTDKENAQSSFLSNAQKTVCISATARENLDTLLETVEEMLVSTKTKFTLLIPYDKYSVLNFIRENGTIIEEEHKDEGTLITVFLDEDTAGRVRSMLGKQIIDI